MDLLKQRLPMAPDPVPPRPPKSSQDAQALFARMMLRVADKHDDAAMRVAGRPAAGQGGQITPLIWCIPWDTVRLIEVRRTEAFSAWLKALRDGRAKGRILSRIDRLAPLGNPGDVRPVGDGISGLRIDYGPGYRVYFVRRGKRYVLLLTGGDKRTQDREIAEAKRVSGVAEIMAPRAKKKSKPFDPAEYLDQRRGDRRVHHGSAAFLRSRFHHTCDRRRRQGAWYEPRRSGNRPLA